MRRMVAKTRLQLMSALLKSNQGDSRNGEELGRHSNHQEPMQMQVVMILN